MSSGVRFSDVIGESAFETFKISYLDKWDGMVFKAGSLRRQKKWLGDIEMVIHAGEQTRNVLARIDNLAHEGVITKQLNSKNDTKAWGPYHRAFLWEHPLEEFQVPFDVFFARPENFGYIWWLRTGPADANKEVMYQMKAKGAPYAPKDGLWYTPRQPKDKPVSPEAQIIAVRDEQTMFDLLGLPFIPPQERVLDFYKQGFGHRKHKWLTGEELEQHFVNNARQRRMF